MKVHPEDVAVQYERLVTLSRELSELASRLGGQAGEALLDESAAKASLCNTQLYSSNRPRHSCLPVCQSLGARLFKDARNEIKMKTMLQAAVLLRHGIHSGGRSSPDPCLQNCMKGSFFTRLGVMLSCLCCCPQAKMRKDERCSLEVLHTLQSMRSCPDLHHGVSEVGAVVEGWKCLSLLQLLMLCVPHTTSSTKCSY